MKDRVQGCVTAGVALVGAGVMAVSPVAPQAPEVLKAQAGAVALAAQYTQSVPELFALSAQRTATGVAGVPLGLAAAALALAQGQEEAAAAVLREVVDGPLWAADPAIYAFDDLLPSPIGGDQLNDPTRPDDGSAISRFRADVLIALRDDVNEAVRDTLVVGRAEQPLGNEVSAAYAATRLAGGIAMSAVRGATSAVTAPLGLVALAQAVAAGDEQGVYDALEAYIDGPNYVLDPIVFAVDDVLPAPIGGDTATDPTEMSGSAVSQFRADVLLAPRDAAREAVSEALGVPSDARVAGDEPTGDADNQVNATVQAAQQASDDEKGDKHERPSFAGALKANAEKAAERAEERRVERAERRAEARAEARKTISGFRKAVRDAVSPKSEKSDTGGEGDAAE